MSKHLFAPIFRGIIGLSGMFLAATASQLATAEEFSVDINKTQLLRLPVAAATVVVGNPEIADISVHSPTMLFVVGRGYGVTNVIVLDDLGQVVLDTDIKVSTGSGTTGKRVLFAGKGWKSYDCSPFCQPAPVLGNDPRFVAQFKGQSQIIDNTSAPIGTTGSPVQSGNPGALNSTFPDVDVPVFEDSVTPDMQQLQFSSPSDSPMAPTEF